MDRAALPMIYLARHGETAWSFTDQHTGLTDLPLTPVGESNAAKLQGPLKSVTFTRVFSSPLRRAWQTCELAGFRSSVEFIHDLVEWDYGEYEGRRTGEIHKERPDWQLFRDGCPGGESPQQVAARADRIVDLVRSVSGNVLLFSSGHFLRILAARWTGMDAIGAKSLMLSNASLSVLGYETRLAQPAIRLWNDTHHLRANNKPHPEIESESRRSKYARLGAICGTLGSRNRHEDVRSFGAA